MIEVDLQIPDGLETEAVIRIVEKEQIEKMLR